MSQPKEMEHLTEHHQALFLSPLNVRLDCNCNIVHLLKSVFKYQQVLLHWLMPKTVSAILKGATTISITTFSLTTLSILTFQHNDTQHLNNRDAQHNGTQNWHAECILLNVIRLDV
jgi:hypothetical protein